MFIRFTAAGVLALTLAHGPLLAQTQPVAPEPARQYPQPEVRSRVKVLRLTPALEAHLKLTPQQKEKIQELKIRLRDESKDLFNNEQTPEDRTNAFKRARELEDKAERDATALLSPEQKKSLDKLRSDEKELQVLGKHGFFLLSVPDLSPEQVKRLKQLAAEALNQRVLAYQPQNGGQPDPKEVREKLRAVDDALGVAIRKVLTRPQLLQFDQAQRRGNELQPLRFVDPRGS